MLMITREETIRGIRRKLLEMVDDDHSACAVAAEKGIMCHGFRRLSDNEFRRRYAWIVRRNPGVNRTELESLANRWELARQIVHGVPLSCDVQTLERDTCSGWESFDDATLARFHRELTGTEIQIRKP